jgi:hypothetical protein
MNNHPLLPVVVVKCFCACEIKHSPALKPNAGIAAIGLIEAFHDFLLVLVHQFEPLFGRLAIVLAVDYPKLEYITSD